MRRCLTLMLVFHVVVGSGPANAQTPVAADDPHTIHQRGRDFRTAGQHLEAARQWLRALDIVEPTPDAVDAVKSHFCNAMQSLADAVDQRGQAREVREAIDLRRPRLNADAELLRQYAPEPADVAPCLDRWQTLLQLPSAPPSAPQTTAADPPPPAPQRPARPATGRWAGLGVSLVGVGAGAVMLGVGGTRMTAAYEAAREKWDMVPGPGSVTACGDNPDHTAPVGVDADCDAYRNQRIVAGVGAGVLAASLVSTIVFAGLLGKHRDQRLAVSGSRLRGGALVQATWRF